MLRCINSRGRVKRVCVGEIFAFLCVSVWRKEAIVSVLLKKKKSVCSSYFLGRTIEDSDYRRHLQYVSRERKCKKYVNQKGKVYAQRQISRLAIPFVNWVLC